MPNLIECPNHAGSFDCTPFCNVCEGEQAYNPADTLQCIAHECWEEVCKDVWLEESGFCVDCSHAYFNHELNPYTLERM